MLTVEAHFVIAPQIDMGVCRDPDDDTDPILRRVADLEGALELTTPSFTGKLANAGSVIINQVNEIAITRDDPDEKALAAVVGEGPDPHPPLGHDLLDGEGEVALAGCFPGKKEEEE